MSPAAGGDTTTAQPQNEVGLHACKFSVCSVSELHVSGSIDGVTVKFLVDTGAAMTVITKDIWDLISQKHGTKALEATHRTLVGVQGKPLDVRGTAEFTADLSGEEFSTQAIVVDTLSSGAILGRDFLHKNECVIDMGENALRFKRRGVTLLLNSELGCQLARVDLVLDQPLHVPGASEIETMVKIPTAVKNGTWMVERTSDERNASVTARAVVSPHGGSIPLRMCNPREKINIPKGTTIAVLEPLLNDGSAEIAAVTEKSTEITEDKRTMLWEMANGNNADLSEEEKACFYSLLLEYADLFAENRNDYGRTDIVQHGIFTGDHAPIRQQVRRLPPSHLTEVQQLLRDEREESDPAIE